MNLKTVNSPPLGNQRSEVPSTETQVRILYYLKLTRELEDRIERKLYRQGKIVGGVYVGRGQEAIAIGSCIDLRPDDVVCPSHRDMGASHYSGAVHGAQNWSYKRQGREPAHGQSRSQHYRVH